ncbi:deoxyribodipyrimidine photo-lyase [Saccharothrix australiensis]|uniref:DNA photolyase n=1 Tax=Saccharothrix australiensis TaxID=2072 RepID=A0A495VXK9_9PSEU|nr:deoxyribodipyrimidine photo-lyase [Saccharothrix australiensis]RKT52358.1 DNA photolyase [Saccharothrix australiensis]
MDSATVVWFRRDLRVADHPALAAAGRAARGPALFVLDPRLPAVAGRSRVEFLLRCLRTLDDRLGGRLMVVSGDPVDVVPEVARSVGASSVHVSADAGPYGRQRDAAVWAEVELVRVGSPYAVTPGRVVKADGTPYRVFTPFRRAWADRGWRAPAGTDESTVDWMRPGGTEALPDVAPLEDAAELWARFRDERLPDHARDRDRPDLDRTSRLSAYPRWGVLHPRTGGR